jgi:hypothetical protein
VGIRRVLIVNALLLHSFEGICVATNRSFLEKTDVQQQILPLIRLQALRLSV